MSADRDVTRIVRSWLHEAQHEDADRVLDIVLDQLDTTPQRQLFRPAWRSSFMSSMYRVAIMAAAAVIVAAFGLTVLVGGGPGGPPASSSPMPTPQQSLRPAPSQPADILGLPPEGATVSDPAPGQLVLRFEGTTGSSWSTIWVYADGRLIWNRPHYVLPNGGDSYIGLAAQRLTPDGVEFLRSAAIATGLFESDLALARETSGFLQIDLQNGDRRVRVTWAVRTNRDITESAPPATEEQRGALDQLTALLNDSASWPDTVWNDKTITAYVPGRFATCFRGVPEPMEPIQALDLLPQPAQDLYLAGDLVLGCSRLTTPDARALAEILERATIERIEPESGAFWLRYVLRNQPTSGNNVWISFEPVMPDGEMAWLGPG